MATELYLYDEIGPGDYGLLDAAYVADALKGAKGRLDIRINSPGGCVFTARAMCAQIARYRGAKSISVDGLAASAATLFLAEAEDVTMAEGAFIMVHNPWSFAMGDANDFRQAADTLDQVRDSLVETYTARGNWTRDQWVAAMDRETWLDADQAIEAGLADSRQGMAVAACLGKIGQKYNVPPHLKTTADSRRQAARKDAAKARLEAASMRHRLTARR